MSGTFRVTTVNRTPFSRLMAETGFLDLGGQTELALRSGVARETICSLCTGTRTSLGRPQLAALAWAMEIPIERLAFLYDGELPWGPRSSGRGVRLA